MSEITERRYLGARDVAKRLSLSTTTLYRLIQRGEFMQGLKFGHSTRWDVQDVDAWAAAQAQTAEIRKDGTF